MASNDNDTLATLSDADLDAISGGNIKGKAAKFAIDTAKSTWKSFKGGVSDGVKTAGQGATVGGAAEVGSRAVEGATGGKVHIPRPSDAITVKP